MEYTEETKEAVTSNIDYLTDVDIESVVAFLNAVGESLYNGELLEEVAEALRDTSEGL